MNQSVLLLILAGVAGYLAGSRCKCGGPAMVA